MSKDSLQNPMHQLFRDYSCNSYIIVAVLRDHCEWIGAQKAMTCHRRKQHSVFTHKCVLRLTILLV